jgi:pimeloyl-ACP methyl ester carboxylesterase
MDANCFDAVKNKLSANDETTLSYQHAPASLSHWLEQANETIIEPTEIVGWSLGGSLAYLLASMNPLVKKIWLINTNVQFSGEHGLSNSIADQFMARYQQNASATRKSFSILVDSQRHSLIRPFLMEGDHATTLQWLYDFNANDYQLEASCHILLSLQDQLVPTDSAQLAWQALPASTVDVIDAQHSLPILEPELIVQWMQKYG